MRIQLFRGFTLHSCTGPSLLSLHHPSTSHITFRRQAHNPSTELLHNTQSYLHNASNGADIWLVGTAHISRESAKEVEQLIDTIQPSSIFIELCEQRAQRLSASQNQRSLLEEVMKLFSSPSSAQGFTGSVAELFLKGFYKYLESMGLNPGLEFKVAMEKAENLNAELVLGDQPVDITMRKLSQVLTLSEILNMMMGSMQKPPPEIMELYKDMSSMDTIVEGMKRRSIVKKMQENLERTNPNIVKVLVHERNAFMVDQLYKLKGRVVGVVGLGHLDGMERLWHLKQSKLS